MIALMVLQRFFDGTFFREVLAKSLSCFSDIDFSICFEAPLRVDLGRFPRFAANAAPAAICCFFDLAGILNISPTNVASAGSTAPFRANASE
jgi:hypothetical protein